jgi:NAD-dependent SIR2 family protein deacetylase
VLQRVWSQNIDTLESAAGVPVELVLEAHGSFATAHCLRCKRNASTEHVVRSGVRDGKVVRCMHDRCDGLVKPDIVFFGEGLPNDFFLTKRVGDIRLPAVVR